MSGASFLTYYLIRINIISSAFIIDYVFCETIYVSTGYFNITEASRYGQGGTNLQPSGPRANGYERSGAYDRPSDAPLNSGAVAGHQTSGRSNTKRGSDFLLSTSARIHTSADCGNPTMKVTQPRPGNRRQVEAAHGSLDVTNTGIYNNKKNKQPAISRFWSGPSIWG